MDKFDSTGRPLWFNLREYLERHGDYYGPRDPLIKEFEVAETRPTEGIYLSFELKNPLWFECKNGEFDKTYPLQTEFSLSARQRFVRKWIEELSKQLVAAGEQPPRTIREFASRDLLPVELTREDRVVLQAYFESTGIQFYAPFVDLAAQGLPENLDQFEPTDWAVRTSWENLFGDPRRAAPQVGDEFRHRYRELSDEIKARSDLWLEEKYDPPQPASPETMEIWRQRVLDLLDDTVGPVDPDFRRCLTED